MLLRNGKMFFIAATLYGESYIYCKGWNGNTSAQHARNATAFWLVDVGNGTTAATAEDYTMLSTTLRGTLTNIANTCTFNNNDWNSNIMATFSSTYKNNTDQPIEVTETGVWLQDTYQDWSDGHPQIWLITHDVFTEEPRVIQPGESHTFTVTIG